MKITRKIYADDLVQGDETNEGEVVRIVDNYENVDCIDVYFDGEEEPLVLRLDDEIEVILDVA